jgi:hypothetical protein
MTPDIVSTVRTCEWIALGYLAYLVALAWNRRWGGRLSSRRTALVTIAGGLNGAIVWFLTSAETGPARAARDWLPALQILIAYWMSGVFYERPMAGVEAWLIRSDSWLFDRMGARWFAERGSRLLLESLELAYLLVYLVVPVGFGIAYFAAASPDVDRYWTVVVGAELGCYAVLPWVQSRPPRALGDHTTIDARRLAVRAVNLRVLASGSIQVNTVPSGHAAGAMATALAVGELLPEAGFVLLVVALGIVAGSVVGRYHYAVDSLLGVLLAVAVWLLRM